MHSKVLNAGLSSAHSSASVGRVVETSIESQGRRALEAEALTLTLIRRSLGVQTTRAKGAGAARQKLVDCAKLVLASDLARRWTLATIAAEVGCSPIYLTQMFQHVEGVPLYRYQLRLRLARALDLLGECGDLTRLSMDLGFCSHSHFSAVFKQTYGRTPAEFQRSLHIRLRF